MADDATPKNKGGRPRKHPVGTRVPTLAFRVRAGLRDKLEQSAEQNERSISEEIEHRVEQAFLYDRLLGNLAGEGPAAPMYRAFQRVVDRVIKMSQTVPAEDRGTPLQFEIRTRKEIQAAISVVVHIFAATEERRPIDAAKLGLEKQPWGQGDRGRRVAYEWLSWEFETAPYFDIAQSTAIDAYWTGKGEELDNLEMDQQEAAWRRYQGGPADRPLEEIMAENGGGRDCSATTPVRPPDSGLDEDDSEASGNAPVQKPKRSRKANPQA